MVERIKQLLQGRQLSTTQFADLIGVARPVVSHVLSGRNKPSLEVVQRILAAFPDLSMAWLLNGTGPMLATEPPTPAGVPAASVVLVVPAAPIASAAPATPAPVATGTQTGVGAAASKTGAQVATPSSANQLSDNALSDDGAAVTTTPRIAETLAVPAPNAGGSPASPQLPLRQPSQRFVTAAAASTPAAGAPVLGGNVPIAPVAVALPVPAANDFASAAAPSTPAAPEAAEPMAPAPAPAPAPVPPAVSSAQLPVPAGKIVRRIVIFYQDGSFADFAPE